jgi:pyridoxal phosphate enzyme (YggS family)
MAINTDAYREILTTCKDKATLVAVSKTKSIEEINVLYQLGQRDFGENYVRELCDKQDALPKDIQWHFIGHLQTNKVKFIAPFVHLIHGVDNLKLLKEIHKEGKKNNRVINSLLQVYIAREETKFGLDEQELKTILEHVNVYKQEFENLSIRGFMGMASFTENNDQVHTEFSVLRKLYDKYNDPASGNLFPLSILSMGMSSDYHLALQEGSNMIRIGSLIFGKR